VKVRLRERAMISAINPCVCVRVCGCVDVFVCVRVCVCVCEYTRDRDVQMISAINPCVCVRVCGYVYRVAKTHRIPYLYRSFSAKVTYI